MTQKTAGAVFWDTPFGTGRLAAWPVGQVVKTPPFHGGNTSSSLVRVTNMEA